MKFPARIVASLLPFMLAGCTHKTTSQVQPLAPPIVDTPPPKAAPPTDLPPPVITVPTPPPAPDANAQAQPKPKPPGERLSCDRSCQGHLESAPQCSSMP